METKNLGSVETETGEKGEVTAVIAHFDVIDHDHDITLKGAFGEQRVPMVYGHDWNGLPIGKGRIYEEGNQAIFEGKFNLETQKGRDAYESVKFQDDLQQWSYGFTIKEYERHQREGKTGRIIKSTQAHEVSPVLVGAGIGTRTTSVKSQDGLRFAEQAELVVAALKQLNERASAIAELRDGKIGADSTELLIKALEEGKTVMETLALLVEEKDNGPAISAEELQAEMLRFQKFQTDQRGRHL